MVFLDHGQRIFDNGEGFEAQKVHFQHARIFYILAIKLRNKQFGVFGGKYRNIVGNIIWGDDYPGSVDTGIPYRAFQLFGQLQYIAR
jgi:hypothetical protein